MARRISSSMTCVRTIMGQAICAPLGIPLRIASPSGPASFLAHGSWNKASGRSDSMARYIATHRAVSETWETDEVVLVDMRMRAPLCWCSRRVSPLYHRVWVGGLGRRFGRNRIVRGGVLAFLEESGRAP